VTVFVRVSFRSDSAHLQEPIHEFNNERALWACMNLVSDISKYASLAARNMVQAPFASGASPPGGEVASQEIT
jgi:hypothetical protein